MELIINEGYDFPAQKIPESKKTDKWFEQCAEAGIKLARSIRQLDAHYEEIVSNYKLVNNIIDKNEIEKALNPFKIKSKEFPVEYKNYPLINPVLELLAGEERKRAYNFMVTVINQDALTEKLEIRSNEFKNLIQQLLIDPNMSEEQVQQKLSSHAKYLQYDFQTAQEQLGNQILNYLNTTLDLKEEFNRGFLDFLISGDEIYVVEIVGGEPILRKGSPLNYTFVRSNNSWKIEDSDIIVEEVYMSRGSIIDKFNEYLTDQQVSQIESGFRKKTSSTGGTPKSVFNSEISSNELIIVDSLDNISVDDQMIDQFGNIKVTRVLWAGFRKVGVISYFNEDMEIEKTLVPETYVPDESRGEKIKWIWIKEWYEATKIGDFYVKKQPCEIQIRNMDNPSVCNPGIVGTTMYSLSNALSNSLVSEAKGLQLLYNLYMAKLDLAIKKFKGRIGKLPLHLIPDGWDVDKWMYYAEYLGWAVEDAFNESAKPVFQGRPAGLFQQGSPVIDLSTGNEIQMYVELLGFIERRFADITGVTPQRKGAISASETVGGVERSVLQSSNITERRFAIHDNTRKRALRVLLEAAKIAWRGKSFVKEYVLDYGTRNLLQFDYNTFKTASYGVDVVDSSREQAALQGLQNLSQSFLQNGGSLSMVAALHRINNLGELQRKIEEYEAQIQQMRQQEAERQEQFVKMQMQDKEQERIDKAIEADKQRAHEIMIEQIRTERELAKAQIMSYMGREDVDLDDNLVPDPAEIAKTTNERIKEETKKYLKEKELRMKKETEDRKIELQEKQLKLKEKELKVKKELEEKKLKTQLKNKVPGEK